ncbi:MAG: hypothetical protein EU542_08190 [Promethearchaeota archaeon]|nr:MAG: hypothetical protein EU542_08190 [Candidatus Lokiarchaeota archaeon]
MLFPEVEGKNLESKSYKLPHDLEGELNILLIPFQRWHQNLVDSWGPYLEDIINRFTGVKFYEIPSLSSGYKMMSFVIDGGMRAGIPSKKVRERTITIYINKSRFKKALEIPNEQTIYIFLVNKKGEILWRESGVYNDAKAEELIDYLNDYFE